MIKKILLLILITTMTTFLKIDAAEIPNFELNNGRNIPQLGLGTFMLQEGSGESEAYMAEQHFKQVIAILTQLMLMEMKEVLAVQSKIVKFHVKKYG